MEHQRAEVCFVEARYPVAGLTRVELLEAMGLLGVRRDGTIYPAYTDWTVHWGYLEQFRSEAWCVASPIVKVDVKVTLPRWDLPRDADEDLVMWFARCVQSLRAHEHVHARIALDAADEVFRAIRGASARSRRDLEVQVGMTVDEIVAVHRRREKRVDATCEMVALFS